MQLVRPASKAELDDQTRLLKILNDRIATGGLGGFAMILAHGNGSLEIHWTGLPPPLIVGAAKLHTDLLQKLFPEESTTVVRPDKQMDS